MLASLLKRFETTSEFVREACGYGLKVDVARLLEPAARYVCPDGPAGILNSRELFEQAALRAVVGDHGNLELSFQRVNLLAGALETLGLTRASDVPDPFRRVWVSSDKGVRTRGVALTCENDEIAVFCPPGGTPISNAGTIMKLSYRGFSSPVEFKLRMNDSCLFPGGLMLHLSRLEGSGRIGRQKQRFDVSLSGTVRDAPADAADPGDGEQACAVLDISSGGVRMECARQFPVGARVECAIWLTDGTAQAFTFEADVRWVRPGSEDRESHGLLFSNLSPEQIRRLERYLERLLANQNAAEAAG